MSAGACRMWKGQQARTLARNRYLCAVQRSQGRNSLPPTSLAALRRRRAVVSRKRGTAIVIGSFRASHRRPGHSQPLVGIQGVAMLHDCTGEQVVGRDDAPAVARGGRDEPEVHDSRMWGTLFPGRRGCCLVTMDPVD